MMSDTRLSPPLFEIGPKAYLIGDEVLELAAAADQAASDYGVTVIFTAPYLLLSRVVQSTRNLLVFAPHMDAISRGRGVAAILPEELVASGADGVMLNHAECPLTFSQLENAIRRAKEVGLLTMVCASSLAEIQAVALLDPDLLVAEPTELIATGTPGDLSYMRVSTELVRSVNPRILVLQAAGISAPQDVYRVIHAGADATGSSSAIALAEDRQELVRGMLEAARGAWDTRQKSEKVGEKS